MRKTNNEIMIYEDKDGVTKVNVKFTNEDLWLTQNQLASIYKTTQQNISLHIKSIYNDGELQENSTNKKFLLVQKEGNREVKRNIDHYNLDMIIDLGYRVQSEIELQRLNLLVSQFLDYAELQALEQRSMKMIDWIEELDNQILLNRREILEDNGKISHAEAIKKAEKEFKIYREREIKELQSDFDIMIKLLNNNKNESK